MIWLSLKTYKESSGDNTIKLLRVVKKVSRETHVSIIPCAQAVDIYRIKNELDMEVWVQHVDAIDPDRHSGWTSPYSIKAAGATGTVINHAERPLKDSEIKKTLQTARKYKLGTLVICDSPKQAKKISSWKPDYIAFEYAELIGGTVSMIDVGEKEVSRLAKAIKQPLIVGAGIRTGKHVVKTIRAGGKGVILASAVVKAKNPEQKLRELADGFNV